MGIYLPMLFIDRHVAANAKVKISDSVQLSEYIYADTRKW